MRIVALGLILALPLAWVLLWVVTLNDRWTIAGLDGETRYRSLWSYLWGES